MRKTQWLTGVILVTLFVGGLATRRVLMRSSGPPRPAYTLNSTATQYYPDGTARPLFVETMYMSATGNWHDIKQYASGMRTDTFGALGSGVFAQREGEGKLHFLSGYDSPRPIITADRLQRNSNLMRIETVLGYSTYVTKASNDSGTEFYQAPIIGGADLKLIDRSDTSTLVVEPNSLVFGEPDPALLKMPSGLPINYENFNKIHGR